MSTEFDGRVWVFGDSITTDAMWPAFTVNMSVEEGATHMFYDTHPDWAAQVRPGDIVVAGRNFGLGSSRPVPPRFLALGVRALVAEEFNSLFLRNAINFGLPALTVPGITAAVRDGDTVRVNLAEGWCENTRTGTRLPGAPLPEFVLDILAAGGLLPKLVQQGYLPADQPG